MAGQYLRGISDTSGGALRPVDPARDRLLIVTDGSSPTNVKNGLVSAVDQLAALPPELPFTEIPGDQDADASSGSLPTSRVACAVHFYGAPARRTRPGRRRLKYSRRPMA